MSERAITPRTYLAVFAALLVLTAITVKAASYDLGEPEILSGVRVPVNTVVALGIALVKATLVVLYFMHVRHSPRLVWVVIGAAVLFLFILLGFPVIDYWSRDWLGNPGT
jgi:cytochrome c oxidase subunit IV